MFPNACSQEAQYYCPFALSFFNCLYRIQNKWEPLVLEWDSENCEFWSRGTKSTKYYTSYFNIYFVCFLVGFLSCVVVLVNPTRVTNISHGLFITSSFLVSCGILLVLSETILIQYSTCIINGFRCFDPLIRGLRREIKYSTLTQQLRGPFVATCGPFFWKQVCIILIMGEVGLMMILIAFTPVSVSQKLDAFHITLPMIFPGIIKLPWLLLFLRLLLSHICVSEACRLLSFYLPKVVYLVELRFIILSNLHRIPLCRVDTFTKWYTGFQIFEDNFYSYVTFMCGSLMGSGFLVFIMSNLITLKCYRILPLLNYLVGPFASAFVFLVVYFSLPFAVHVAESTRKMIEQRRVNFYVCWYNKTDRKTQKYVRRKFNSLRPTALNCGGFYSLVRGTEANYYFYVLLRTADLLLTTKKLGII